MKINIEFEVPVPPWARRFADGSFLLRRGGPITQGVYEHWPVESLHNKLCWLEGRKPDCAHCTGHGESNDSDLIWTSDREYEIRNENIGSAWTDPPYDWQQVDEQTADYADVNLTSTEDE